MMNFEKHGSFRPMYGFAALVFLAVWTLSAPAFALGGAWSAPFAGHTAYVVGEGRFEVGVFDELRYGVSENVEISAHPLWMFVMPNVSAKIAWVPLAKAQISTRHALVYPTLLLGLLAREGTGGILPPTTEVPHIFGLTNELLVSGQLSASHTLTWKGGVHVAPRSGGSSTPGTEFVTIDLPLIYARTAAYHSAATVHSGLALDGPLLGAFSFLIGADMFFLPGLDEGRFAFEQGTTLRWNASQTWILQAGYKLVVGSYPFGNQTHLLPTADVKWSF